MISVYEKTSTMINSILYRDSELMESVRLYKASPKKYKYSDSISGFIYVFKDEKDKIIYIGKTTDLIDRMLNHNHLSKKCYEQIKKVEYFKVDYFIDLDKVEKSLIKEYSPKYNTFLKAGWNEEFIKFDMDIEWSILEESFYPLTTRKKMKKEQLDLELLEEEKKKLKLEARSIKRVNKGIYKSPYSTNRILKFGEFQYYKSDDNAYNKYYSLWKKQVRLNLISSGLDLEELDSFTRYYKSPNRNIIDSIEQTTFIENVKTIPYKLSSCVHKTNCLIQSRVVYEITGITKKGKLRKRDVSIYKYSRQGNSLTEYLCVDLNNKKSTVYMYSNIDGDYKYIVSVASGRYNPYEKLTKEITEEEAYKICSAIDYKK